MKKRAAYYTVSEDRQSVYDPVTGKWLDWQTVLELVWHDCQEREKDETEMTNLT